MSKSQEIETLKIQVKNLRNENFILSMRELIGFKGFIMVFGIMCVFFFFFFF